MSKRRKGASVAVKWSPTEPWTVYFADDGDQAEVARRRRVEGFRRLPPELRTVTVRDELSGAAKRRTVSQRAAAVRKEMEASGTLMGRRIESKPQESESVQDRAAAVKRELGL